MLVQNGIVMWRLDYVLCMVAVLTKIMFDANPALNGISTFAAKSFITLLKLFLENYNFAYGLDWKYHVLSTELLLMVPDYKYNFCSLFL